MTDAAYHRAYHEANGDVIRARSIAHYANLTPEQKVARKDRDLELRRGSPKLKRKRANYSKQVRDEVIAGYGGRCACCANDYRPHLTLDHVNGDGAEQRRKAAGNAQMSIYFALRRALRAGAPLDPTFQVLCQNCNVAKHWLGRCGCQDAGH